MPMYRIMATVGRNQPSAEVAQVEARDDREAEGLARPMVNQHWERACSAGAWRKGASWWVERADPEN